MTVLVYVNTSKQVGEPEHVKALRHQERRGNLVREKQSRRRCLRV